MNLFHIHRKGAGAEFPTPQTVDVLAEVSEWRTGRNIGHSTMVIESLASDVSGAIEFPGLSQREILVRLAAHAIARIELIDRGDIQ